MGISVPGAAAWPAAPASATAPAPAPRRRRPGPRCPEGPGGLGASASWGSGGWGRFFSVREGLGGEKLGNGKSTPKLRDFFKKIQWIFGVKRGGFAQKH